MTLDSAAEFESLPGGAMALAAVDTPLASAPRPRDPRKQQQALVAVGRRAIAAPDLALLTQDAALLLAETLEAQLCGVAELAPGGKSFHLRLMHGADGCSRPRITTHEVGADAAGSLAGYVLQAAHPVLVEDLAQERRFADRFLRRFGVQSALAVPLRVREGAFGSLAAYSTDKGHFGEDDVPPAETIAHLVATTIDRKQTEDLLAEAERRADAVLETVDALVLLLDPQGQITEINRACRRVTDFAIGEIKHRTMASVFAVPEEVALYQNAVERLQAGAAQVRCEAALVTKHSQRRRIAWSYCALFDREGALKSIIAAGIDVTQERDAETRAQRAEQSAEQTRQALAALAVHDAQPGGAEADGGDAPPSPEERAPVAAFAPLPVPRGGERRKRARRSYPYTQMIAFMTEGKLPPRSEFFQVRCYDIAAGGFSFFSAMPPKSDALVIALGAPPKITYLTAQVAHVTRMEQEGRRMFLIGCNYASRANY